MLTGLPPGQSYMDYLEKQGAVLPMLKVRARARARARASGLGLGFGLAPHPSRNPLTRALTVTPVRRRSA